MKKIIIGTIAIILVAGAVTFACGTFCSSSENDCQKCCSKTECCDTKK